MIEKHPNTKVELVLDKTLEPLIDKLNEVIEKLNKLEEHLRKTSNFKDLESTNDSL